jgi:hypothetical protein
MLSPSFNQMLIGRECEYPLEGKRRAFTRERGSSLARSTIPNLLQKNGFCYNPLSDGGGTKMRRYEIGPPRTRPPNLKKRLSRLCGNLIVEIVATTIVVGLVALAGGLVNWLLGDRKFFDWIPVRWVFDAGDLAIAVKFVSHN